MRKKASNDEVELPKLFDRAPSSKTGLVITQILAGRLGEEGGCG